MRVVCVLSVLCFLCFVNLFCVEDRLCHMYGASAAVAPQIHSSLAHSQLTDGRSEANDLFCPAASWALPMPDNILS